MLLQLCLILNLSISASSFQSRITCLSGSGFQWSTQRTGLDLSSPLFGEDANDEELFSDDSERSLKDGEDMAKLFYKEIQRRNNAGAEDSVDESPRDTATSSSSPSASSTLPPPQSPSKMNARSPEELRKLIASTGSKPDTSNNDDMVDSSDKPQNQPVDTKFTGQNSIPTPTPQPFSRSPREAFLSSRNANAGPRTPREVMMEREYQLVDRAERNIGIQAAFAVLALAFYIYVGLSGGISSRLDEPDLGADEMMPFEQLAPTPRDRENTVWL